MPSGPKKRLRAKRKKQGSPATDANSDRETESLSITGSMDVDDLESVQDTPVKGSSRTAFLDSEAMSSQTDEWVRVSDFDVGTPTSQTGENDPSADDGDIGSSRKSLDKLAEWETVSSEHIPGRQDESINTMEEQPECEAISGHSSESYTNLPSPHLTQRDKEADSTGSERMNRMVDRSSCSTSSTGSLEEKTDFTVPTNFNLSATLHIGDEVSSSRDLHSVSSGWKGHAEEIKKPEEYSFKEEVLHGAALTAMNVCPEETRMVVNDSQASAEDTITRLSNVDDQFKTEGTTDSCGPASSEGNPVENKQDEAEVSISCSDSGRVTTNPDEDELTSTSAKLTSGADTFLSTSVLEEVTFCGGKEVHSIVEEDLTRGSTFYGEKFIASSFKKSCGEQDTVTGGSLVDVGEEKVSADEKLARTTRDERALLDENEVSSTSVLVEEEKSNRDAPHLEVATFVDTKSVNPLETTAESLSVKSLQESATSESIVVVEETRISVLTPVDKTGTEKHLLEAKSLTGCCGVVYWLLGWDH